MKKLFFIAACVLSLAACNQDKKPAISPEQIQNDSLRAIITARDNEINDMMGTLNEIQQGFAEINEAYVKEHGIRVVRRLSGGGAVYHDLGNLNFTFIADAGTLSTLNFTIFCEPVIRTLAKFGITAEVNGRNDMTIDGRKFSGNSQYLKQGRIMHHGTILFDSDLSFV